MASYVGATVFVDHYYKFISVNLIYKINTESTFNFKLSFARIFDKYRGMVINYHTDNGLFDTKMFKQSCNTTKKKIRFYFVNDHIQKWKYENRIKYVTTGVKTNLLHEYNFWTKAIKTSLWLYTINIFINLRNSIPKKFKPETYNGRNKISSTYDSPLYHYYPVLKLN